MIIVVVCNSIKLACFLFAVRIRGFEPLITLGDGLASFLRRADPYTKGLGTLSAADISAAQTRATVRNISRRRGHSYELVRNETQTRSDPIPNLPLQLGPWQSSKRLRWFSGASSFRWELAYSLLVNTVTVSSKH
jgi:hypothetical protein